METRSVAELEAAANLKRQAEHLRAEARANNADTLQYYSPEFMLPYYEVPDADLIAETRRMNRAKIDFTQSEWRVMNAIAEQEIAAVAEIKAAQEKANVNPMEQARRLVAELHEHEQGPNGSGKPKIGPSKLPGCGLPTAADAEKMWQEHFGEPTPPEDWRKGMV